MTEAISCRDEDVYLVGGANSAGQAALYFARYARRVHMLVRGDSLSTSMSQYLIAQITATPTIAVELHTVVAEAHGETRLEGLTLRNDETGETYETPASSLFIFIGAAPQTEWLAGVVERDPQGFILTGSDLPHAGERVSGWPLTREPYLLETNVPGVFAAGDVRHGSIKRVATGVGEGAVAVSLIHQYLQQAP